MLVDDNSRILPSVDSFPECQSMSATISSGAKYSSDVEHYVYVPEKALLAAILERAVRDILTDAPKEDRRTALSWLRHEEMVDTDNKDYIFSFQNVIGYLGLSEKHLKVIRDFVQAAESNNEKLLRDRPRTGRRVCSHRRQPGHPYR